MQFKSCCAENPAQVRTAAVHYWRLCWKTSPASKCTKSRLHLENCQCLNGFSTAIFNRRIRLKCIIYYVFTLVFFRDTQRHVLIISDVQFLFNKFEESPIPGSPKFGILKDKRNFVSLYKMLLKFLNLFPLHVSSTNIHSFYSGTFRRQIASCFCTSMSIYTEILLGRVLAPSVQSHTGDVGQQHTAQTLRHAAGV